MTGIFNLLNETLHVSVSENWHKKLSSDGPASNHEQYNDLQNKLADVADVRFINDAMPKSVNS